MTVLDRTLIERARAVDILSVATHYGARLRKAGGGEFAGPCPLCGGRDRFNVNVRKGIWICRGCDKGDDVIALVRHLDGCGFNEAIARLTGETRPTPQFAAASPQCQRAQPSPSRARALRIWREAVSIFATPAARHRRLARRRLGAMKLGTANRWRLAVTDPTKPNNATAMVPLSGEASPVVPDDLLDVTARDAGLGVSTDPADQILPLITVLQTNSPAVDKRSPDYIDRAEPGCFRFRGDLIEIRDGVAGFTCIPCAMQSVWLEWGPNRGSGLFGRHLKEPDDVEVREEDGLRVRRGSGNVLQHVREFYILVDGKPHVLSFHGTGHITARKWQSHFHQFRHPKTGGLLPAYARKYRITTVARSNASGRWFAVKFEDRGWVSKAEYEAGPALHEVIARGTYRVELSAADTTPAAA
jgi:hypothetical protein